MHYGLHNRDLDHKTNEEIKSIFSNLSPFTALSLSCSNFWEKTAEELKLIFSHLPPSITALHLSNQLYGVPVEKLKLILSTLLPFVTTLDLNSNGLGYRTVEELTLIFSNLSSSVTTLDLSYNELNSQTAEELTLIFSNLSSSVTTLVLGSNRLGCKTAEELTLIFSNLSPSVTTLNLRDNGLDLKTAEELKLIFSALSPSVTTLDLSFTSLNTKTAEELKLIFSALSPSVTTLDLSYSGLNTKTAEELKLIFSALSPSVTTLNLSIDDLLDKSEAELETIMESLPVKTHIKIEGIEWDSFKLKKANALFKRALSKDVNEDETRELRQDAFDMLLSISEEASCYPEAAKILWVEIYHGHLLEVDIKSESEGVTESKAGDEVDDTVLSSHPAFFAPAPTVDPASISKVHPDAIKYAFAAKEIHLLFDMIFPGLSITEFDLIYSVESFDIAVNCINQLFLNPAIKDMKETSSTEAVYQNKRNNKTLSVNFLKEQCKAVLQEYYVASQVSAAERASQAMKAADMRERPVSSHSRLRA